MARERGSWRGAGLRVLVAALALWLLGVEDNRRVVAVSSCTSVVPGDANGDDSLTVADVLYLINFLFAGGPQPVCDSDADGSGQVTVSDVLYLINHLFAGGPPPAVSSTPTSTATSTPTETATLTPTATATLTPTVSNDLCAAPDALVDGTAETWSTLGAADDYALSCLPFDGPDTVHSFSITTARAVLVTLTPLMPFWEAAVALRSAASCATTTDVSCVADGFATRYINRPNLAAGTYDVVVDGNSGQAGDYSIKYETRAADVTYGYWRIDSNGTFTPLGLADPTVPGFVAGWGSDEASWELSLPFTFNYFGNRFTTVNINSNMFLTFQTVPAGAAAYTNECPLDTTTPNDTIALLWDDAVPSGTATLKYRLEGAAPNRRMIIEFKDWDFAYCRGATCSMQGMTTTQQVILYENGDIELRYGPRSNAGAANEDCGLDRIHGCSATIGLENATGTEFDAVQCNTATPQVADGRVIYFVHPR